MLLCLVPEASSVRVALASAVTPTLTHFLLNMMRATADDLARANTDKLAARYQIPAAWVRFYITEWMPFARQQETTR